MSDSTLRLFERAVEAGDDAELRRLARSVLAMARGGEGAYEAGFKAARGRYGAQLKFETLRPPGVDGLALNLYLNAGGRRTTVLSVQLAEGSSYFFDLPMLLAGPTPEEVDRPAVVQITEQ